MDAINPVLAHRLGLTPPAHDGETSADAVSPLRQLRRAFARAADTALGLPVTVTHMTHTALQADELIESGPDGWIVIGLRDAEMPGLTGLILMDPPMRSAVNDLLTMGDLAAPPSRDRATQRPVTRTDAVMAVPFVDCLLKELAEVDFGGERFDIAGFDIGPMDDLRTAGLVLTQGACHMWAITLQIGGADHQGELRIALRPKPIADDNDKDTSHGWPHALRTALDDATS